MPSPKQRDKKLLTHQLTDDELLNQLDKESNDQDSSTEVVGYKNDVLSFCANFNIIRGSKVVKKALLWSLYKYWTKDSVGRYDFYREMSGHFYSNTSRGKNGAYYKINRDSIDLSKELGLLMDTQKLYKVKSTRWNLHFSAFMKQFELEKGDIWIEVQILFWLYDKWLWARNKKLNMSYVQFLRFVEKNFTTKITSHKRYAKVGDTVFNHVEKDFIREFREKKKRPIKKTKKEEFDYEKIGKKRREVIEAKCNELFKEREKEQKKLSEVRRIKSKLKSEIKN